MVDTPISGFPAITSLGSSDLLLAVQAGNTSRITAANARLSALATRAAAGTAATAGLQVGASTVGLFSGGSGATEYLGLTANGTEFLRATASGSYVQLGAAIDINMAVSRNIRWNALVGLTCSATTLTLVGSAGLTTINLSPANAGMMRLTSAGVRIQSGVAAAASDIFHVYSNTLSKNLLLCYEATGGVALCSDSMAAGTGAFGAAGGVASSTNCVALGSAATASASSSVAIGSNATAANAGSISIGTRTTNRSSTRMSLAPCSNPIAASAGVTQIGMICLARETTNATPTVLASTSSAAGSANQSVLANNSAYKFRGTCIATITGAGDTASWTIEGCIKRGASAATTALVGTPTVTQDFADAGAATWALAVTADTTNGCIAVTATGEAGKTIRWNCFLQTTEVTF